MTLRISRALLIAVAAILTLAGTRSAIAIDTHWIPTGTSNYNLDANWDDGGVPDGAGFNERAVIDNGGTATLSTDLSAGPFPGGLVLGLTAGQTGNLSISAPGSLDVRTAGSLVGTITIGSAGRGYLTMNGGTLKGTGLTLGGQNVSPISALTLSGSSTLTLSGGNASATLAGNTTVTGPNVRFSNGNNRITFQSPGALHEVINSAGNYTTASFNTSNAAVLGGNFDVTFSGVTPTPGQFWNFIDATAVSGGFANVTNQVPSVIGGPAPTVGAELRLKTVAGGTHGQLLQLSYDKLLVLQVNQDTGELKVTNPLGGAINIDGYAITSSTAGSLKSTYKGISGAPAGDTGWAKSPANGTKSLTEVKQVGSFNTSGIGAGGISLGTGFDKLAVDTTLGGALGTNGQDLVFSYDDPVLGNIRGQVQYSGTSFENNLVLTINSTNGAATLKNDSLHSLSFDGYSILSSTGALAAGGYTGIGVATSNTHWEKTTGQAPNSLSESNPNGPITLAAGASVSLGNIGSFGTAAAQAGVSLQFIRDVTGAAAGDYNNNGIVDAADYTVWRDHLGQAIALPNEDPGSTPGSVTIEDYNFWKANFGHTGGGFVGEDTFRTGAVHFTTTGPGAAAGVPEPATNLLLVLGFAGMMLAGTGKFSIVRRNLAGKPLVKRSQGNSGEIPMSTRLGYCVTLIAAAVAFMAARPAAALTQGIALTNGDFELPGPVSTKTVSFDSTGVPLAPNVARDPATGLGGTPGWTFTGGSGLAGSGETNAGLGNETFGDNIPGDSGTEGGGHPGNALVLSTLDGRVFQTSAFNVVSNVPNQDYRLSFDAQDIFTVYSANNTQYASPLTNPAQLTARLYYGASRTTLGSPLLIPLTGSATNYVMTTVVAAGSPAIGQPIGVEFDTTSYENSVAINAMTPANPIVSHSWAHVDNVVLQIAGITPGDLNGDGLVDINDYRVIRDHLQTSSPYLSNGELTGDSAVNLNDFRAWVKAYGPLPGAGAGSLSGGSVPEPSTLLIAVSAAAVFGATRRGRRLFSRRSFHLPALACAMTCGMLMITSQARATVLAYEPFNYTVGDPLVGKGPVNSFFSGSWKLGTIGAAGETIQSGSLAYLGKNPVGGANSVNDNGNLNGRTGIALATDWDNTTVGTFYIGYEMAFGTIAGGDGGMGFRSEEFWPAGNDIATDSGRMDIGYNQFDGSLGTAQQAAATAQLKFDVPSQVERLIPGAPSSYIADNNRTHLIVLRFDLSATAGADVISLYLDPTSSTEPILPNVTSGPNLDFTLHAIGAGSNFGGGALGSTFDELRVGTTYADVIPTLPFPGDTDDNGTVDLVDYNNIFNHLGLTGQSTLNGDVAKADGTQGTDGVVDLNDFHLWKVNFPHPGAGAGATLGGSVPEPTGLALAIAGVVTLASVKLARRRQQD